LGSRGWSISSGQRIKNKVVGGLEDLWGIWGGPPQETKARQAVELQEKKFGRKGRKDRNKKRTFVPEKNSVPKNVAINGNPANDSESSLHKVTKLQIVRTPSTKGSTG